MKSISRLSYLPVLAIAALASCGGDKAEETEGTKVDTTKVEAVDTTASTVNEVAEMKFSVFLANVPSPMETMVLLPATGIAIDKSIINSTDNADKYSTVNKKALNYGVYGTDLGYLAVYEQTQAITDYFATVKSLAEELGASQQFDNVLTDRFQANLEHSDSLMLLMDKAMLETENYLKNNQRIEIATYMLVGSWVETQYLVVRSLLGGSAHGDLTDLYAKIPEQKIHVKSLIDLLAEQKSKDAKALQADLEKIKAVYDAIPSADVSDDQLHSIEAVIKPLRTKITSK
jgi:hypothetical protein